MSNIESFKINESTDFNTPTLNLSFSQSLKEIYLNSFCYAKEILQNQTSNEQRISFDRATDIRAIAKSFNINIVEIGMNRDHEIFRHALPGYLDYYDYKPNKFSWTIYVNKTMGDLTKRYIIAHELAHFFIKHPSYKGGIKYCANPLFPKTSEEQMCDLLASFLLMPIEKVFDIMTEYIENHRTNDLLDMYEWLRYLGCELGISDYHTITCFQNVRYLAGIIYEIKGNYIYNQNRDYCKKVYDKMLGFPNLFQ